MEKRVFLAMIITVMVFMVYASLNPAETDPDTGGEGDATEQGAGGGDTPKAPGRTPDGAPAGTPSPDDGDAASSVAEAAAVDGPLVLETSEFRAELAQRGGVIRSFRLLEHDRVVDPRPDEEKSWEDRLEFISAFDDGEAALGLEVDGAKALDLDAALWNVSRGADDGRSIEFSLDVTEGGDRYRLTKKISLTERRNRLDVSVSLQSLDAGKTVTRTLWLRTSGGVYPVERTDVGGDKARTLGRSVVGARAGDEFESFAMTTKEMIEAGGGPKLYPSARFAADMGIYFGAYLHVREGGENRGGRISSIEPAVATRSELERLGPPRTTSELGISLGSGQEGAAGTALFDYYVGPKDHRAIRLAYPEGDPLRADYLDVADGELMSQGMCPICSAGPIEGLIKSISKAVIWVLTLFNNFFGNLGVAIIVLTICVRLIMFPVTRKSQVAMQAHSAKMARIKPKLDKLKEKYKDNQKKIAEEQMRLMKEEKVGMVPLGGCLPMFLQIPIFFGLFTAIRFDVDLRHAEFLWCSDLSMPDRVIAWEPIAIPCFCPMPISIDGLNVFPLLMIAAMIFHQMGMPKSPDPQMQQQQKMMMFMPLMFGVMLYGYPAGLAVYWLSSSLFGIFEQRVIRKFFPVPEAEKPATT